MISDPKHITCKTKKCQASIVFRWIAGEASEGEAALLSRTLVRP